MTERSGLDPIDVATRDGEATRSFYEDEPRRVPRTLAVTGRERSDSVVLAPRYRCMIGGLGPVRT